MIWCIAYNFWFSLRPLLPKLIIYLVRMWWSKRKSNFFPSYAMLDWNIGVHLYQQSAVSFKLTKLNETNWFVPFKWAKRVRPTQLHSIMFLSKKINAHFNNWILMTFFWFGYVVIQPMHKNGWNKIFPKNTKIVLFAGSWLEEKQC